jgi:hypothetical protein
MLNYMALNWQAILVATIAGFVLGGLWYGPVFGRAWADALGKRPEDIRPSPLPFIVSFITALVTATVLALLIGGLGIVRVVDGTILGLVVGIGFIATAMGSDSAFCGWGLKLFLIQSGYRVTYSALMGAILTWWR